MGEVPPTKQQYVYTTLREEIQSGGLLPGDPLTVIGLAERFGVSAIPVREALRQLEQEGLIEMTPHVSVRVKGVSVEEALWAAELRLALEPMAARAAMQAATPALVTELTVQLHAMDSHAACGAFDDYMAANRRFHDAIYGLCPNKTLVKLIHDLWDASQRFRNVYQQEGHLDASRLDHEAMLAALRNHDADALEAATRRHRERNLDTLRAWAEARATRQPTGAA